MNNSDIRKKQLREYLDEDMNVQKRVMRTQIKVQQATPSGVRERLSLDTRVKYNLSNLFNKFRLGLEDTIDSYNQGMRIEGFGEIIRDYNQIVNYITAYAKQNQLSTQDQEFINKQFDDLLPYVTTVSQIASNENSIDKEDVAEFFNRYRSKDRSPVGLSESLVKRRQEGYDVIAPQEQIFKEEKERFARLFDRIENSQLEQDEKDRLANAFSNAYEEYTPLMSEYFARLRTPNSPKFKSVSSKLRQINSMINQFEEELNAIGI